MKSKPVIPRQRAVRDVEETIAYYLDEGGQDAALGFIDALERAYQHIGRHAASGSSRWAYELGLPGLRTWPLTRYPHLVFYVESEARVDVWRVLHAERDLAGLVAGPDPDVP